ncbi:helix-turn-helix domain-containing protein [Prevotella sp. LCP21S3_D2]|uniref:helix-turn-helix domain-containing protein n=1 Tax=Prevotella sp. LCP21S3_D2 TaxID=3438800 RepID=UPI003F9A4597
MMLEEQYGTCKHANTGMHAPQGLQTLQPMQTMQSQDSLDSQEATELLTPLSEWHDNYEVMEMFHISARTLQTLRSNGKLPFAKMGGRCYYKERDLQRLMDESYRDSRIKPMPKDEEEGKMQTPIINKVEKGGAL